MSDFPLWIIGILLVTVGSLGNNLGNNLVSLDHALKREDEEETNKNGHEKGSPKNNSTDIEEGIGEDNNIQTSIKYNPTEVISQDSNSSLIIQTQPVEGIKKKRVSYRITGTVIFIVGNLFTFGAFGFGAQSLLASLESIQFVSNLFFVRFVHQECVTIRMVLATLSIIFGIRYNYIIKFYILSTGNVMVVVFATHTAILFDSVGMIKLYKTNYGYWGYLLFALIVWLITNGLYQFYYKSRVICKRPLLWKHNFLEPFCYACSSAIVGTQAVLNSKCMAMLIQVSIRGDKNEFASWFIWMIFGTWILMVAYWLNRIDTGLKLYPPLFIIPVMQVFFVFFAIVCGGIYFREFDEFITSQWIGFSIGVFLILLGVYGLAPPDLKLIIPHDDTVCCDIDQQKVFEDPLVESDFKQQIDEDMKRKSLAMKLKSPDGSSKSPCILGIVARDMIRPKPVPYPKIKVASNGTVLVTFQEIPSNKTEITESNKTPLTTSVLPVSSNYHQGIILPPLNHNDSFTGDISLSSSPSSKKIGRKVVKRRPNM